LSELEKDQDWTRLFELEPSATATVEELQGGRLAVERLRPKHQCALQQKEELLTWYDELIAFRMTRWPDKAEETRQLLRLRISRDERHGRTIGNSRGWGTTIAIGYVFPWVLPVLFAAARKDRFHFEVALRYCQCAIHGAAEGQASAITPEIRDFLLQYLSGKLNKPKTRGPHRLRNLGRDGWICDLIQLCVDNGVAPYRNEASEHNDSACDLVAELCAEYGLTATTYEAVRKIWSDRHRRREEFRRYFDP
jgi:hypothetical protein